MKLNKLIKVIIIFLIGFLSANIVGLYFVYGSEMPLELFNFSLFNGSNSDNSAPFDFVDEKDIIVQDDRIIINIKDASLSRYAATGSMLPLLDEGSNGIRIKPESVDEIHVGDIITFEQGNYLIVHRVVEKGIDEKGIYFITKGDNSDFVDGKIRFNEIKYITIGVIW